jgi:hypothetical protein
MSDALTYDLMLETVGILRSPDIRVRLERELELGETIDLYGRRWVVTEVQSAQPSVSFDRRAIARELSEIDHG